MFEKGKDIKEEGSGCRKKEFTVASLQEQRLLIRSGGIIINFLPSTVNGLLPKVN